MRQVINETVLSRSKKTHSTLPRFCDMSCSSVQLSVAFHIKTSHFFRGSPQEVFLGKGVLKIIIRFTGENPHRSVISISCFALLCSPVNLLYIFRTTFSYEHFWRTAFVCCLYLKRNTGLREQNSSCKLRLNVLLIYIF